MIVWGAIKEKRKLQNRASIISVERKSALLKIFVKLNWCFSLLIDSFVYIICFSITEYTIIHYRLYYSHMRIYLQTCLRKHSSQVHSNMKCVCTNGLPDISITSFEDLLTLSVKPQHAAGFLWDSACANAHHSGFFLAHCVGVMVD